ncbi:PLP-dependent transferase [Agrococcus sp. SL85]|uniref:O-acetylhomoserine aminocarboxypropyltransferase/cysteine synthase family protein n=1 Tax=Agrococcus sp. SL85 TaxID=2995141 RepID=UPI00226D3B13|nr:PLP-dependent transferase [Agrococcus sp. SL85]WAC66006.1 PLP-dependent transferase [Agrococcus sp. SL85]
MTAVGTVAPARTLGFETRQVHAGAILDAEAGARVTPIYQSAGYVFDSFDDGALRFAGRSAQRAYSRNDNPTNVVAARRIADLEGGLDGVLVASGQAAIAAALGGLAQAGDRILAADRLYEGTREMVRGLLRRQGLAFDTLPIDSDEEAWVAAVRPETRAIYAESIANPLGEVADLDLLGRVSARTGVPLVVDNTVATPYLNRPIEHGAAVVIHSTSKWLGGHGSVIGGAIVDGGFDWDAERFPHLHAPRPHGAPSWVEAFGRGAYGAYLRSVVVLEQGPTMPPTSTFLLLHGIETLSLRMERHVANAHAVIDALAGHPAIARIHHPSLDAARAEVVARLLPDGAGSVVSLDLAGGRDAARAFLDRLELVSQMTHIGDVRTLAIHTGSTIHGKLDEEERLALGVTPGLVRLSIGIERADDIVADLLQALDALSAGTPGTEAAA